jgi:urea transporter
MQFFLDSIFFSYAQIFFSNRKWFGIAAMLTTFIVPEVGIMGLLGVSVSNALAIYFNFDKEKIRNGFYGFNGILIASAAAFFFKLTLFLVVIILVFVMLTFLISSALEHLMANVFNLPGLSLPFVISFYIFVIFINTFNGIEYRPLAYLATNHAEILPEIVVTFFKSFALIFFQSSVISGAALLIIVLLFSRVMFVNSIITFVINYILVQLIFDNPSDTFVILTSFNAILTSIALGGSMVIISKKTIPLLVLSSLFIIIFTVFFSKIFSENMLPVLVLPFNFVVLSTIYSLKFRQQQSELTLLYFKPGSPEENYYYHQNRTSRFDKFKYLFPELPFWGEWQVSQGIDGGITHKDDWKYAWDFVLRGEDNKEYSSTGTEPEDYYCFNTPVIAPLDGEVVKVIDNVKDNKIGEANLKQNWGNTIIIDHGQGLYSSLSHLKRKSILVKEGEKIKKGDVIAKCGNSGRSPTPHLHFQFQLTDKLGDKTYKFPFSHFLIKCDDNLELKTFDYPDEGKCVRNIETHKSLKNAYNFKLGDEFNIDYKLNSEDLKEHWEVKVDILNNVYIENKENDRLFIYPNEKVFYSTNYIGGKNSALYFFYLTSVSLPLGFYENLSWQDTFPVSVTVKSWIRYITEFFLLFRQSITSQAVIRFAEKREDDFVIELTVTNKGLGLFSFFKEEGKGEIIISSEGMIKSLRFKDKQTNFEAKINKKDTL